MSPAMRPMTIPEQLPVPQQRTQVIDLVARQRAQERRLAEQLRIKKRARFVVACMLALSVLAAGLLYRHAKIVEATARNNALRREIDLLRYENKLAHDRFLKETDYRHITREALRLFGLRKPSQAQRVVISLPKADRVVREGQIQGIYEGAEAYAGLEAYMAQRSLLEKNEEDALGRLP